MKTAVTRRAVGAGRSRLVVHPVALGRGLPLFSEMPEPLHLELAGTTRFKSGVVAQVYRRGSTG